MSERDDEVIGSLHKKSWDTISPLNFMQILWTPGGFHHKATTPEQTSSQNFQKLHQILKSPNLYTHHLQLFPLSILRGITVLQLKSLKTPQNKRERKKNDTRKRILLLQVIKTPLSNTNKTIIPSRRKISCAKFHHHPFHKTFNTTQYQSNYKKRTPNPTLLLHWG